MRDATLREHFIEKMVQIGASAGRWRDRQALTEADESQRKTVIPTDRRRVVEHPTQ